jgi:predicted AAA+ superfamily ATPase
MIWRIMTPYRPRELARLVAGALDALPVVVVTGLRQAGKTTFLRRDPLLAGRRYLTLDDFATLEAAQRDPQALVGGDDPITIDEVQRCPDLLLAVKREVDRRRRPGQFVLSGSANLALLAGISESLAGRALYLTLTPFTRRERLGRLGDPPFLAGFLDRPGLPVAAELPPVQAGEVLDGGLPSIVLGETGDRALWLLGYEQTYLDRDVRSLSQVADLVAFRNLARLAALRTGQVLNQSELARDAKLPPSTVSRYLGLLEASFLLCRLRPFLESPAARLIKSPKLFIADSGLAGHLTGVTDIGATSGEPLRGALFETFVAHNLAGILGAHLPAAELAFWSVQGRYEVDFVVSVGRRSLAIEVKAASRFGDRDTAGLRAFLAKHPEAVGGILAYNGAEAVPLGEKLFAVPLARLLS